MLKTVNIANNSNISITLQSEIKKMKKIGIVILSVLTIGLSGCVKDVETFDFVAQLEKEKPVIQEYVEQYMPNAIHDEYTAIWYEVINPGEEGSYVYKLDQASGQVLSPRIKVNYEGKLLNGIVFDSNNSEGGVEFELNTLITAWHAAFIPKSVEGLKTIGLTEKGLQKGAEIRFVTPSYLGYRNERYGSIPENSPLDFTIKVIDIR